MAGIIESQGWSPEVDGVDSGLDSMGRGTAKSIEGHAVRISFTKEQVSDLSSGAKFDIDSVRD